MEKLTKRERVETALSRIEPDKVPTDITITVKPYKDLCLQFFSSL